MRHARSKLARFGARVRELRERAGLTQAALADAAGIDRIAVSNIERGQRDVGVLRAAAIARALGVPPGDLFPQT
jgi:transcriptional regulator with XRE-family HTH domain